MWLRVYVTLLVSVQCVCVCVCVCMPAADILTFRTWLPSDSGIPRRDGEREKVEGEERERKEEVKIHLQEPNEPHPAEWWKAFNHFR